MKVDFYATKVALLLMLCTGFFALFFTHVTDVQFQNQIANFIGLMSYEKVSLLKGGEVIIWHISLFVFICIVGAFIGAITYRVILYFENKNATYINEFKTKTTRSKYRN